MLVLRWTKTQHSLHHTAPWSFVDVYNSTIVNDAKMENLIYRLVLSLDQENRHLSSCFLNLAHLSASALSPLERRVSISGAVASRSGPVPVEGKLDNSRFTPSAPLWQNCNQLTDAPKRMQIVAVIEWLQFVLSWTVVEYRTAEYHQRWQS
jgi:hypothetical protein